MQRIKLQAYWWPTSISHIIARSSLDRLELIRMPKNKHGPDRCVVCDGRMLFFSCNGDALGEHGISSRLVARWRSCLRASVRARCEMCAAIILHGSNTFRNTAQHKTMRTLRHHRWASDIRWTRNGTNNPRARCVRKLRNTLRSSIRIRCALFPTHRIHIYTSTHPCVIVHSWRTWSARMLCCSQQPSRLGWHPAVFTNTMKLIITIIIIICVPPHGATSMRTISSTAYTTDATRARSCFSAPYSESAPHRTFLTEMTRTCWECRLHERARHYVDVLVIFVFGSGVAAVWYDECDFEWMWLLFGLFRQSEQMLRLIYRRWFGAGDMI